MENVHITRPVRAREIALHLEKYIKLKMNTYYIKYISMTM